MISSLPHKKRRKKRNIRKKIKKGIRDNPKIQKMTNLKD